jgi:hypothetical protein
MPTIDVIGDIHGYADKLRALLNRLGYEQNGGVYSSPDRKAIFVVHAAWPPAAVQLLKTPYLTPESLVPASTEGTPGISGGRDVVERG